MQKKKTITRVWSIPALIAFYPIRASITIATVTWSIILVQGIFNLQTNLLPHVVAVSSLASLLPFVSANIHKAGTTLRQAINEITEDNEIRINAFFETYERRLYSHWAAYLLPLAFTAICLQSIINLGIPWQGVAATAYDLLIGLLLLITSSVGWHFLNYLLFLRGISQLQIKGAPFGWNKKEFRQISTVSFEIFTTGAAIYLGAIFTVWLVPWGNVLLFGTAFGYLWAFPLAAIVITYFIINQYLIHQIIRLSKEKRLENIDSLLKQTFTEYSKKPSKDKNTVMGELINWRTIVSKEPDWPINIQANLAIISGVLAPAIGTVIERLINK